MKQVKRLLFILLLIASVSVRAQVGIGGPPAASAQLDVISTSKGFLPPRMNTTQRNAIAFLPQGLTIYNTSINAYEVYNGNAWYSTVHFIGENYGGGIIYYIYDNGQHGLIAATQDASATQLQWYNGVYRRTGTTGDGVNAGAMNTKLIIATQMADNQYGNFAAKACAGYSAYQGGVTYNDWYLPSRLELYLMILQKTMLGIGTNKNYYSSTELDTGGASAVNSTDGGIGYAPKNVTLYVRAVRSF